MLMQASPPCPTPTPAATARWSMVARCFTALVGGYGAAAALATLLARLLPIDRAEATALGVILSVLLYALIGLWCFHEPRLGRVAAWTWGLAIGGGALVWLLGLRP